MSVRIFVASPNVAWTYSRGWFRKDLKSSERISNRMRHTAPSTNSSLSALTPRALKANGSKTLQRAGAQRCQPLHHILAHPIKMAGNSTEDPSFLAQLGCSLSL